MMKLTIGKKMFFGFLSVLVILAATVVISYSQITSVDHAYDNLIEDKAQKLIMIEKLEAIARTEQVGLRGYILIGDDTALKDFNQSHEKYTEMNEQLEKIINQSEAKLLIKDLKQIENEYYQFGKKEILLVQEGKTEEAIKLIADQGREILKEFNNKIGELTAFQEELLDTGNRETSAKVAEVKNWVLVLGVLAILLGLFIALFIGRIISKPVAEMAITAQRIASGDLTVNEIKVKNRDEIGELASSFNQMTHNLRTLIQQVRLNVEQVAASAEELTASAEQNNHATEQIAETMQMVAAGVDKQVQIVEETSETINELAIGVQQIAKNAQKASCSSIDASEKALEGDQSINTAVTQMNSINETVEKLSVIIRGLGARSKEIEKIIEVITNIADQTNLLALNAAIEAARAGDQGREFAVVAGEVRKLAEQSSQSALQISQLISSIKEETNNAVESMELTAEEVISGIKFVNTAGHSFRQIQGSINEAVTEIQEVSAAVQQMAAGSEQIVASMKLINEVAESSASGTQEVSAATEEQLASMQEITVSADSLAKMAEELQLLIGKFHV